MSGSSGYWDGRGDNLFLKSSNHDWSSVGMCLVASHKCILIVLAKLELSTGTEWYNIMMSVHVVSNFFQIATRPTVIVWISRNLAHVICVPISQNNCETDFWNFDSKIFGEIVKFQIWS